ncbi:MAG: VaFE repeat-containing surface-anchored protein, partial [Anaerovoracaceae bacterium]
TRSTEGNVTTYTIKSKNDSSSSSTLSVVDKPISIDKKTNDSTITVKKVDGDNKLSGAVFTLYSDYGCTTEITDLPSTDENGKVTISTSAEFLKNFLPSNNGGARSIYLKETKAPIGYKLNNKVYTLTLNTSVTTELNSDKTAKIETTTYSITCEDLNEDSKEITVSDQPVVFDLTVNKMWADDLNGQQETVTVQLTKNGTGTDQKVTLNETNHWTATFTDLRKYDESGNEITYGVIEIDGDKHYNVSYYQSDSSHIVVYNKAKTIELHTTVAVDNINSSSDKALSVDCMNLTRNIVDTVSYSGLDTTKTYTVVGRLVDVTDVNNEEIITQASEVFQPEAEKEKGSIGVDFGKVSLEAGHKYVVYEYLYTGEISNQEQNDKDKKLPDETPTAEHHDNNDKAQTFVVKEETPTPTPETPSISTTVSADGESSTSEKAVETSSTSVNVIDKVTYKNLTAGTEYTLQGQLMDVTDKDNIVSVGDAKTETFTPSESNGTQDIDLGTLDLKPGHTYVVYETLYKGSEAEGTPVAEHKDKDDKAQTVVVKEETSTTPSISTTVSANGEPSSSTKPVEANRIRVKVVDKVFYENLTVGKEYTVKGQLMDITDRDNVISVGDAHTTTFTPTESSGTVNVDFGTMKLTPGHTYVIHETLYEGAKASGTSVFVHDDNDNKAQTVIVKSDASISKSDYPSIRTTISADGEKSTSKKAVSTEKTRVHVVDKVYYNNLTLGETYTLKGKLIDLTSGDTVVKTASMTFTAKKSDGYVKLDFGRVTVEPGHKYVAFEYLYDGAKAEGSPVAEHKDKNEKSQTIIATGTANTRTSNGNGNGNGGNGNGTGSNNGNGVRTGDNASLIWGVVLAGTVAALLIVIRKRRSSER